MNTLLRGLSELVLSPAFDHIEPDQLMVVADTIVGLLDRMPGARPRHPAAAV
jgi:hypothetical protein